MNRRLTFPMVLMRRVIVPVLANIIALPLGLAVALWPLLSEFLKIGRASCRERV